MGIRVESAAYIFNAWLEFRPSRHKGLWYHSGPQANAAKKGLTDSQLSTQTVAEEQVPNLSGNGHRQLFSLQFTAIFGVIKNAEVHPGELEHCLSIQRVE